MYIYIHTYIYIYIHIYICIMYTQCVLEGLISFTKHLRGEPHKEEVKS